MWAMFWAGMRRWAGELRDPESRRGAALIFAAGGGMTFTFYALAVLVLLKEHANYVFYLGLGALILVAIVQTGLMGLLVSRSIRGSILGNKFEIDDHMAQVATNAAAATAAAIVTATPPAVDGTGPKG